MSPFTRILFARPTIWDGLARLFDSSGSLNTYNTSRSPQEADEQAIRADWSAVGEDVWSAFNSYRPIADESPESSPKG